MLRRKLQRIAIAIVLLTSVLGLVDLICEKYFYVVDSAKVQFIVIEKTPIPRFAFVLSSLPLALATYFKYGERSFVMVPATLDSALNAFATAEFLVVGTHGSKGAFSLDDGAFVGTQRIPFNPRLKFIYFGACEIGEKREKWSDKYPGAEIISYDGSTSPLEGWIFLAFESWRKLLTME